MLSKDRLQGLEPLGCSEGLGDVRVYQVSPKP